MSGDRKNTLRDKDDDRPITFSVPGLAQPAEATRGGPVRPAGSAGRVKVSIRVGAARAGGAVERVVAVPGQDVVALHIAGGPVLMLHPCTARDLMLAQSAQAGAQRGAAATPHDVQVPTQLGWPGLEQAEATRGGGGWAGKVLLSALQIIGFDDPAGAAVEQAADFAASLFVKRVDGQVEAGVYGLSPDGLAPLKGSGRRLSSVPPSNEPMLVFLHGTFVDTASTFGKLWALYPDRVRALFTHYGSRVYALDHPTVSASPIANALTLVQALPQGARLHLVTHSRGGLVAEVLARVAGQGALSAADLSAFSGSAHAVHRQELQALASAVQAKAIRVERVVRVASPARGTLLASKRLDAYLSVLKWSLELAGLSVLPALLDFLTEVARRRADPSQLPGLAAMMPDSPLLAWLNGSGQAIPGDLRVVAGDLQGDSIVSWLKTLLADAYYWTDNDIVVQTRSMYGGAPREQGALFLLDRGGKVTHFNYFANDRTVQAVVAGLTEQKPAGFELIGPLSWAGQDSSGLRAARRAAGDTRPAAERPAVFVLPGILGSNLKAGGQRIWLSLHLVGGLDRLRYTGAADGVLPDGPIGLVYDKLLDHLSDSHEVIPFAFDWRCPIENEARRLADAVERALDARSSSGQPVRLLAHSMGGVLARVMQLERPKTFERLMQHEGARLLMLGTPNGGSWAPMQVLSGDDTFGNALAALGSPLANHRAREIMAAMPGLLQLQAGLLDPQLALDRSSTWQRLADADREAMHQINWWHGYAGEAQEANYRWGVPPQAVLDAAKALRLRLDAQRDQVLPAFANKLCLVVGRAKQTPDGFEMGERGLSYLNTVDSGDGRVPLLSALLPGVRTWTLDVGHGELPSRESAFGAFVELLHSGDTVRLARLETAATRGAPRQGRIRSRPSRLALAQRPAGSQDSVFLTPEGQADVNADSASAGTGAAATALRITVLNGNLSFIAQPLLVGHYRAAALSGTEAVVDRLIGGTMALSLAAGLYPETVGAHQVFANTRRDALDPWRAPRPRSVIVVGLGEEGSLRETDIVTCVRQGALAWAQRVAEDPQQGGAVIDMAATLMGSGGIGISAAGAATAVARGVHEANQRLQAGGWPVVGRLTLVELYLDRANEAWQGLRMLAAASAQLFDLAPAIESGTGPLRRQLDGGYRGADYDLVAITGGTVADTLSFAVDTRRARTEVRAQATQGKLLREMVGRAAQDQPDDPQIGRTLFQLLVPVELEPYLGGNERVVLELDESTAPIPWELLDTGNTAGNGDNRPWALRTQLLRRLRKASFRSLVRDANADDAVLVIGEPQVDLSMYAELPGARAEAEAVVAQLTGAGGLDASRVRALLGSGAGAGADASAVINALLARPYRMVHIAGHGEPPLGSEQGGGVVLSGGHVLGPREINSMRTVPELVFVNCCHLAAFQSGQTLRTFDPSAFAAGVADQLISIGVRCVVAAGWAVDDAGAAVFAATFYRELLAGRTFMRAVAAAREATWADNPASNTWAAYQCYGDPDWTYRSRTGDAQAAKPALHGEYDAIASPVSLTLALEELLTRSRFMGAARDALSDRLRHLEARFAGGWGDIGAVAEAFGLGWLEAGDHPRALAWYGRALQCNDGSATLKAQEQWLNLRVRVAWAAASQAHSAAGHARAAAERSTLKDQAAAALQQGRATVEEAARDLQRLVQSHPTLERLSLLGSAYKRLALMERLGGHSAAERRALGQSMEAYAQAEKLATESQRSDLFYPALNRMAIELVLQARRGSRPAWDRTAADTARASLVRKLQDEPDFWSHVGLVELSVYEAVASGTLVVQRPAIEAAYADVHGRVAAAWLWASVADQALFTLVPYAATRDGAERRAAQSLLGLLGRFANPVQADFERWDSALSVMLGATPPAAGRAAGVVAHRGAVPASHDLNDAFDAVVWHNPADSAVAAAAAAALAGQGLRVWQRQQVRKASERVPELRNALRHARLALVVIGPGQATQEEATMAEWTLLQEAAWRPSLPTLLATVARARAQVPGFLQEAPRLDASALGAGADGLAALLSQMPAAEGHKP